MRDPHVWLEEAKENLKHRSFLGAEDEIEMAWLDLEAARQAVAESDKIENEELIKEILMKQLEAD